MQKKQSMLPPTQLPTRYPGAQLVYLRDNPTQAWQTTQTGEPTYWLMSSRKSSLRNTTQLAGLPDVPKYLS